MRRADSAEAGFGRRSIEVPDAEEAKTAEVAAVCWSALGRAGLHPHRRRRRRRWRRDHRPRRLRGGHLAARRPASCTSRPVARHGRRRRGRQDRHQHRGRQEPGRRVPPAGRRPLRPGRAADPAARRTWRSGLAEVVKCGFIADPAILDLVEPTPRRRSTRLDAMPRASRRGRSGEGRRRGRRPPRARAGGLGREVVNYGHTLGHADRADRGLPLAARGRGRGRHGLRRRARPARGPPRRDADRGPAPQRAGVAGPAHHLPGGRWAQLLRGHAGGQEVPGQTGCGSSCSTDSASPAVLEAPDPALLLAAYAKVQT